MDTTVTPATRISPVLGRYFERTWTHGEGHRLFDDTGRSYLDFAASIAVSALGHRHPRVTAAIHEQVDRLIAPTGAIGYTEPVVRLAEALAATAPDPLDTVMFLNSGSEAIEASLKMARRTTGRPGIVAFRGGFHGRTFGAASVTSSSINYRKGYEPLLPGVHIAPFPAVYRDFAGDEELATASCLAALEELTRSVVPAGAIASVVIEPIQGEGGYTPAPAGFLRGLREFCDRHGIVLIADEVQTGFGRTGTMWAVEHAGVVPDVIVTAKAIANGLPLAAIIAPRSLHERWGRGAHGSTYGGNPVACAASLAVLETIHEEGLLANAAARGAELVAGLRDTMAEEERIGDVRGRGLMVGVEFVRDRSTREPDGPTAHAVMERAADLGLLVLTCGSEHQVIRWMPPFDVSSAEIIEGLEIFREALRAG